MKGLIRKDLYQCLASYKLLIFYFLIFFAISAVADNGIFFLILPCIILGMLPVTFYSVDEKEGWCRYSATMPVSRGQYIGGKYLLGLIFIGSSAALCCAFAAVSGLVKHELALWSVLVPSVAAVTVGLVGTGIAMPFCVRFGANKGRIIMMVFMGACAGFAALTPDVKWEWLSGYFSPGVWMLILGTAAGGLYALSWLISVHFYKKLDL